MTFKWHIKSQALKAIKVANALKSLGNTIRGVPPYLLRKAAAVCVILITYYAGETWWPGRTRPGPKHPISSRIDTLLQSFTKEILAAAREVLPVWKTTPTSALYRESGLSLPEIALNVQALSATIWFRRLDPRHPLRIRAGKITSFSKPISRFARRSLSLPKADQVDSLNAPPWTEDEPREAAGARVGAPHGFTKKQAAQDFQIFLKNIAIQDIIIYSDGSKLKDGQAGAGFVVYQRSLEITRRAIPLGPKAEVFDAETIAALAGVEADLALPTAAYATNLWICLDNLEVALRLGSPFLGSSQETFIRFMESMESWKQRSRASFSR